MMDVVAGDKILLKELKEVYEYLKTMDNSPDEFLSDEQLQILLGGFSSFHLLPSAHFPEDHA